MSFIAKIGSLVRATKKATEQETSYNTALRNAQSFMKVEAKTSLTGNGFFFTLKKGTTAQQALNVAQPLYETGWNIHGCLFLVPSVRGDIKVDSVKAFEDPNLKTALENLISQQAPKNESAKTLRSSDGTPQSQSHLTL